MLHIGSDAIFQTHLEIASYAFDGGLGHRSILLHAKFQTCSFFHLAAGAAKVTLYKLSINCYNCTISMI